MRVQSLLPISVLARVPYEGPAAADDTVGPDNRPDPFIRPRGAGLILALPRRPDPPYPQPVPCDRKGLLPITSTGSVVERLEQQRDDGREPELGR